MTVIIIILSSFRLSYIIINKSIKILELTFYIFVYVFLGLAPLIQIDNGIFPWGFNIYRSSEIFHANIIILLGLLGFEIGLKLADKKNKFNKGTEISKSDFKSFFIYTAISITVFIVVTALIGLENVFKPRNDAITATGLQSSSNLILNKLQEVPMYIGLVFGLVLWKYKDEKNKLTYLNLSIISILVFLLLFNLILNTPISSARFWVGTIYMSIIIIFIKWKPFTQSILVISIFSIFIFVFPYADLFRDSLDVDLEFVNFSTSFLSGDYDAFQQIMNSVKYTDIAGYSFGYQLLGVLFFWVPRSIWLDKPVGSG